MSSSRRQVELDKHLMSCMSKQKKIVMPQTMPCEMLYRTQKQAGTTYLI